MDEIKSLISKFKSRPSILNIKQNFNITAKFSIKEVSVHDIKTIINNISTNKASGEEISLQILKYADICFEELKIYVNNAISNGKFPYSLKLANVTSVHQKDPTDKCNFGPVSVLPLLVKIFERVISDHLSEYMDRFLNKLF